MNLQDVQTSFARERALLLLREVGQVARSVLASTRRTLIAPRLFVLNQADPAAAQLLEIAPPSRWLSGLSRSDGVHVFTLEFRDAYTLLEAFEPEVHRAVNDFEADAAPCLVVTEGGFVFLPLTCGPTRVRSTEAS